MNVHWIITLQMIGRTLWCFGVLMGFFFFRLIIICGLPRIWPSCILSRIFESLPITHTLVDKLWAGSSSELKKASFETNFSCPWWIVISSFLGGEWNSSFAYRMFKFKRALNFMVITNTFLKNCWCFFFLLNCTIWLDKGVKSPFYLE